MGINIHNLPKAEDTSGFFIPTMNQIGYMTTHLDPYSQMFVDYAAICKGKVLEIGAAYGVASLAALAKGANVISNDIDARYLELAQKQATSEQLARLELNLAAFPHETHFPENSLDTILICRVLHFFDGDTIMYGLKLMHQWLAPGGKLLIEQIIRLIEG